MNMIVYDDNGEAIKFDDELNPKVDLDVGLYLEKTCNGAMRSKKGIPNRISTTKEVHSKTSLKEKRKDKCKKSILQNLKHTNAKINLLELFE